MQMSDVQKNLDLLSDEELSERYGKGYYEGDVKALVLAEIKSRGLPLPSDATEERRKSFLKRHPLISLVMIGLVAKVVMEVVKKITQ